MILHTWAPSQYKDRLSQVWDYHVKDKTVATSYPYIGETTYLYYWDPPPPPPDTSPTPTSPIPPLHPTPNPTFGFGSGSGLLPGGT